MLCLPKGLVGRPEITMRNSGPSGGEKHRYSAVLPLAAIPPLSRPQFPPDFDDLRCTDVDPFGLGERSFGSYKVTTLDRAAGPFYQLLKLAVIGSYLGDLPACLGDPGEAGRRLVGLLQGQLGTREVTKRCESAGICNQVPCLVDLRSRRTCRRRGSLGGRRPRWRDGLGRGWFRCLGWRFDRFVRELEDVDTAADQHDAQRADDPIEQAVVVATRSVAHRLHP